MDDMKLELIYKTFLQIQNENPENYENLKLDNRKRLYFDDRGNTFDPKSRFFSYLIALRDFGGFPTVLPDGKYYRVNSKQIYHGFREYEHGAQLLTDFNYHVGIFGAQGTFFTECKDEAVTYTWKYCEDKDQTVADKGKILRAKIVSDNSCTREDIMWIRQVLEDMEFDKIENEKDRQKMFELYEFCFKQKSKIVFDEDYDRMNRICFYNALLGHDYTLAVFLGYDNMICYDDQRDYNHYVLFNRAKMIVPASDVKKFCDNSKNYIGFEYISE